ncbi:MAG: hypothetical protein ACI9DH_000791 [Halioglobus sp.]|jgi:hypothetical protein
MEPTTAAMMTFGAAALLTSWVVLLIVSWKEDYAWGLCTLLLPPLSYCYALFQLDKAGQAIIAALIGVGLILLA